MSDQHNPQRVVGRLAQGQHPNRFETVRCEADWEQLAEDDPLLGERRVATEFLPDATRTVLNENRSPDIPFRYSINPYRGCEHGCAYCYARPTHELLGLDAALDFEAKVLVKHDAPALLRAELNQPSWQAEPITISGVTDCYQPAERQFQLTRQLLEVMLEARQPVGIITKNALVLRDLDLLAPLAARRLVHVNISLTTLDAELARTMEPRTSTPAARLRALRELSAAGVPCRVMVAPVVPGLTDEEMPALLAAAREAGASAAGYTLLRLPLAVRPIFEDWLMRKLPHKRDRILARIRDTRGGAMNDAQFGRRLRGEGEYAEHIVRTYQVFTQKLGLDGDLPPYGRTQFRPPRQAGGQLKLF